MIRTGKKIEPDLNPDPDLQVINIYLRFTDFLTEFSNCFFTFLKTFFMQQLDKPSER